MQQQYQEYMKSQQKQYCFDEKQIKQLAAHIPSLWASTKNNKDKKRIVRLLISDITVTKDRSTKTLFLNIRWKAGAIQQLQMTLPPNNADKLRYPAELVNKVRTLTQQHADDQKTAALFNQQGLLSSTGKPFTKSMIEWIRHKHSIPRLKIKSDNEFTVAQVQQMFNISRHMVYYWIERKYVAARKMTDNSFLITVTPSCTQTLKQMIADSYKANTMINYSSKVTRADNL